MPVRPMDSSWWSSDGLPCRWGPQWDGYSTSQLYRGTVANGWLCLSIAPGTYAGEMTRFFQAPFSVGGIGSNQQSEDNYDTGFFYINSTHETIGGLFYPSSCGILGRPNSAGIAANQYSQCKKLQPDNELGDLRPISSDLVDPVLMSAYYKTGFIEDLGYDSALPRDSVMLWFRRPGAGFPAYIYHYQPYAWNGSPVEVFAAILLQMGMDADDIEQAAFTDANIRYESTLGDLPWTGEEGQQDREIYCWRRVGQSVMDLLIDVMSHSRDIYFTNERGKIDVSSFTSPDEEIDGLTLSDGVLGGVSREYITSLIFNSVYATWGHAFECHGGDGDVLNPPDESDYAVNEEPTLDSYIGTKYTHSASNAASVAKYGAIYLGASVRSSAKSGVPREMVIAHYPMFLTPCGVAAGAFGGMTHVTHWLASDGKPRRIVTLRQDFRALDWGIGAKVKNVAVTGDGATIGECWCTERTYDFNRLTVTSVLMEQPSNT